VFAHHHIRPLKTDDGPLLDRVMDGMSTQSRYQRYHVPKPRLNRRDREYLTAVDERDHLALVAISPYGTPLGVARAVRLRDDPDAAEVGVEVIDARQGHGLGTELTTLLARRARAVGIRRFVAEVLAQSALVAGLERRGWRRVARDGAVVTYAFDVS
jgi:RimJ/RimL family protein N-acetyltransferase